MRRTAGYLSRRDRWIPRSTPGAADSGATARRLPSPPASAPVAAHAWRIGTPVVVAALRRRCSWSAPPTATAPTCARAATPTSPRWSRTRPTSTTSCASEVADLNDEVATLSAAMSDRDVEPLPARDRAAQGPRRASSRAPAPGVTVTLSDAPEDVINTDDRRRQRRCSCTSRTSRRSSTRSGRAAPRRSPSRASGWSPPPASSARATRSSSRACPTPSPTSSRRSATRASCSTALEDDDYVAAYRDDAADPEIARRLGARRSRTRSSRRRTTACST